MKKAPKKYATGGEIDPTDPKKKKKFESTTNSQARQLVNSGQLNKTIADTYESPNYTQNIADDNTKKAAIGVQGAGTGINSGRTFKASDANGNTTYQDNTTGETYMVDRNGKRYKKGGMVKAPRKKNC